LLLVLCVIYGKRAEEFMKSAQF